MVGHAFSLPTRACGRVFSVSSDFPRPEFSARITGPISVLSSGFGCRMVRMTLDVILILLAMVLAVIPCRVLYRIDHNLAQTNRNLEQILAALQAKPRF